MATITLNISREDVFREVDKTTDYTGSKLIDGDDNARDRIAATEDDMKNMSRFWEEACATTNERLKEMVESSSLPSAKDYSVTLKVSVAYDMVLTPSVESTLRTFFITFITGKWYVLANKGETKDYMAQASELMEDIRRKLYSRKMIRSPRHRG